jgi:acetate kinase
MNVLVVNIGSTSFKFRLLDMAAERLLGGGSIEGVGVERSRVRLKVGDAPETEEFRSIRDQSEAVRVCIATLQSSAARGQPLAIDAIGFKAVHGGPIGEPVPVTDDVLRIMEEFAAIVPAHNPPYLAAMRAFAAQMPDTPQVAAFETGFHQTIPEARSTYAVPHEWKQKYGVRRYGFHGASHRYVAEWVAQRLGRENLRIISCHLGGSSSICAIQAGRSVANSFGMAPQSGTPQNNRVGDFDPYALPLLRDRTGQSLDELLETMATQGGLLGLSGLSNDARAILKAARKGHERARLALDVFVESVRHYLGAYVVALGGLDVLVFTGGIGERSPEIRQRVCEGLAFLGIALDVARNQTPPADGTVSADGARVRVLAIETNEELVVARQTQAVLTGARSRSVPERAGSNL